ncbi:MAG: single-stranded DNA-binding protein, partial [Polymorphobacter sp.]
MAGSVNKVILVGNLGADPEIKSFANGGRIANMRIATSESWRDKASGERKEKTEWHNITINNDNLVPIAEKFLRKGSKIYVEGALQTRKWQDRDGNDRYTTEVVIGRFNGTLVLLDGRSEGSSTGGGEFGGGYDDAPRSSAPAFGGGAKKPAFGGGGGGGAGPGGGFSD